MDTAVVCEPSIMLSSTPVTVTVCGVSQLPLVNVNVDGAAVASFSSADETENTTSVDGCTSKTTVNVSVEPFSPTDVEPPDSEIVNASPSARAAGVNGVKSENNDVKNAVNRTNSPTAELRRLEKYDRECREKRLYIYLAAHSLRNYYLVESPLGNEQANKYFKKK